MSKEPVRISRLQNYANQLVTYRALHKDGFTPCSPSLSTQKLNLMSSPTLSAKLKALSAPPLLVNAVIEALLSSPYGSLTSVIPGEADAYCAHLARQGESHIFTSDSDLLVHDLGKSCVVLFKDIEVIQVASKGKVLRASQYHPSGIAQKFGLPKLLEVAFFLSEDNHRAFQEAIRLAKEQTPSDADFATFAEQYGLLPMQSTLTSTLEKNDLVDNILARLDPRVSELIHQIRIPKRSLTSSVQLPGKKVGLTIYLPFLIDDPTKTTAWQAGESIRVLTYSLLRLLDPHVTQVSEFLRKGTRVADTVHSLYDAQYMTSSANLLKSSIRSSAQKMALLSHTASWRAFAAETVCAACLERGKAPPELRELADLVRCENSLALTWPYIHASAQLQAVLYSLRVLHQVLLLTLALLSIRPISVQDSLQESLQELSNTLETLPSIADMLEQGAASDLSDMARSMLSEAFRRFSPEDDTKDDNTSTKRRKKKQKKTAGIDDAELPPAWKSNNIFSSLA